MLTEIESLEGEVLVAAMTWWMGKRPLCYTESQHVADPEIYCTNPREQKLARVVAAYIARTS